MTRTIRVFADVVCPFTHVGLRRVVRRRDEHAADLRLFVEAWPLEWVNGAPLDPALIGEEVAALRAQIAPELFTGFDVAAFPATSVPALALAAAAYERDAPTGESVSFALRTAVFEEGRDVADPAVLRAIAREHELDPAATSEAAVREQYEEGRALGVVGSPYFVVGTEGHFCPSLDIEHHDGRFSIRFDPAAFDAFMTDVLAG